MELLDGRTLKEAIARSAAVRSRGIDESRKAYDQFFAAFAHADASLPILAAAKGEYGRLKSRT